MLYLSAKHSRSLVWWEDSIRKMFWETFESWVLPYLCERPVKNPSIWKESLTWIVPWIRSVRCGGGTQCKRNYFSPIKWKNPIPSRRWTNKIRWRRSGTENIHLDTGSSNSRRRSKRFSVGIRRVSTSTTSRLISGCRWSNISLLVHVRKLHMPPSTLNPESNFTRREKNHFLFHWHIYIYLYLLTHPELLIQIWMSSKNAASISILISMDQETCLILGQVSPSLLHYMRNLQTYTCGLGGEWQDGKRHLGQIIYGLSSG